MMQTLAGEDGLLDLFAALAGDDPDRAAARLASSCTPDARWHISHPFNTLDIATAAGGFWATLKRAFPNYEYRPLLNLRGEYEGREWLSTLGHVMGSFQQPWLGIPPTHRLSYLRVGVNASIRDGAISEAFVMLDIPDLMRQAGYFPFREAPGSAEQWPAPPSDPMDFIADPADGAKTLAIVRAMQGSLGFDHDLDNPSYEAHSGLWHRNMNWFGPAGIGSARGEWEYLNYHCALFDGAFPDVSWPAVFDDPPVPMSELESGCAHYIQIAQGRFAVTGGWPSLAGTHTGPGWLGLPPSGQLVRMRVADWYAVDGAGSIADNWVMIDIPHVLVQCGFDILADLQHRADPRIPRWNC